MYYIYKMIIDQTWVKNNFDIVTKVYNRLNRNETTQYRYNDRKKMLENMDTVRYRGYYELARKYEKEKVNNSKSIGEKAEEERLNLIMKLNTESTQSAIDLLEEQLDEKQDIIDEKDKQINKLLEIINQKLI